MNMGDHDWRREPLPAAFSLSPAGPPRADMLTAGPADSPLKPGQNLRPRPESRHSAGGPGQAASVCRSMPWETIGARRMRLDPEERVAPFIARERSKLDGRDAGSSVTRGSIVT